MPSRWAPAPSFQLPGMKRDRVVKSTYLGMTTPDTNTSPLHPSTSVTTPPAVNLRKRRDRHEGASPGPRPLPATDNYKSQEKAGR